jgi:hypothetical protein
MDHVRASKKFCGDACKMAFHRSQRDLRSRGLVDTPTCHLGRFQDYQETYAGKIDVVLTDPPYGRKHLPLYEDLATFARAVLRPGGWLVCLTGFVLDLEARQFFNAAGLEYITVGCYHMPSVCSQARRKTSTGWLLWQEHHKPLLWYQQPGTPRQRRRGGGNDTVEAGITSTTHPHMDQKAREWEQALGAFQAIVRLYTTPADVVLDPMMGWGTTLEACLSLDRRRCIGIELLPERYAYARTRLGMAPDQQGEQVAD